MYDELPPEEEKKEKPKEAPKEGEEQADEPSMKPAGSRDVGEHPLRALADARAKLSKEWKSILDEAVVKFKEAGCAQSDVDQALKVHRGLRTDAYETRKSHDARAIDYIHESNPSFLRENKTRLRERERDTTDATRRVRRRAWLCFA